MKNPVTSVRNYLQSSWAELQKVTWPTRETTLRYSAIVIVVSIAVAGFFAALDFGFSRLVSSTLVLVRGEEALAPVETPHEPPPVTPELESIDVQNTGEGSGTFQITPAEGAESGETIEAEGDAIELEPSFTGDDEGGVTLPPLDL